VVNNLVTTPVGILKPCYIFSPRTLVSRIGMAFAREQPANVTVRLPWGAELEVNANEGIGREIFRQNIFDIAVSELAWRMLRAGDVAVDVGANVGYMTSLFASRVGSEGRVEAFEPHPTIFERLRNNVARIPGGPDCVKLHNLALGRREGTAELVEPSIFGINEGASRVVDKGGVSTDSHHRFEIRVMQLDSMLPASRIRLLKVDVEGFESEVLAGAQGLLAARSITNIIYEAHDCGRSPLHNVLMGYGYRIFGIGHSLLGPRLSAGVATPSVDRSWESPSYLATLDPQSVEAQLKPRGWQVLRGR